jgi:predicted O-methyltransferase YrrM
MEWIYKNLFLHTLTQIPPLPGGGLGVHVLFLLKHYPLPIKNVVEIGVFNGNTSMFLRHGFPEAHLYLIDPWQTDDQYLKSDGPMSQSDHVMKTAYENVCSHFGNDPQVTILRTTAMEAAKEVPNDLDLVIIDGNHDYEYVKNDIQTWLPKLKSKGILVGDDYHPHDDSFPGVKRAVHESFPLDRIIHLERIWAYIKD